VCFACQPWVQRFQTYRGGAEQSLRVAATCAGERDLCTQPLGLCSVVFVERQFRDDREQALGRFQGPGVEHQPRRCQASPTALDRVGAQLSRSFEERRGRGDTAARTSARS
jgi:hypothetical protein